MKTKRANKIVLNMLSIMLVLLVVTSFLTSSIFARYSVSEDVNEDARVAKWDIRFGNNESLHSVISSTHLESGSFGSWGLDISNLSEVHAKFSEESNLKIRLQSPNFNISHEHNQWDFLHEHEHAIDENPGDEHTYIDNPINFRAYMYNCSLEELAAANGNLLENNITEILVFDTDDEVNPLRFQMVIDNGELYFECIVNVGERLNINDDFFLEMGTGKASLVIKWEVDDVNSSVASTTSTFKSYYMIKQNEFDSNKYDGIYQTEGSKDVFEDVIITIDSVNYVLAYKEYDYFEYLLYTSSIGGEIMITFNDGLNDYIKRCTKLTVSEKTELEERTLNNPTEDKVNKYIELLEYQEYNKFLQAQEDYINSAGYLGLSLECRIVLDIRVEQVD